jgi:hypothetical protein
MRAVPPNLALARDRLLAPAATTACPATATAAPTRTPQSRRYFLRCSRPRAAAGTSKTLVPLGKGKCRKCGDPNLHPHEQGACGSHHSLCGQPPELCKPGEQACIYCFECDELGAAHLCLGIVSAAHTSSPWRTCCKKCCPSASLP